ncbi:MAG TPA: DUF2087 domain-containing protein [Actinomycetota bacterium]|nr:DUF2087 domain-containing protein [Actinomycetota bacterium]
MTEAAHDPGAAIAEAAATLGVLADIDRFKVIAAIALGSGHLDAIVERTGVDRRSVERSISRLSSAGLITADEGFWRVRFDELQLQARAAAAERDASDAGPESSDAILRRFFKRGRLMSIPASHSKRVVVLDRLAQEFEPGRTYEEAEVNAMLERFHEDYASLRRYLVDDAFLERSEGKYWRAGGTFEVG